MRDGAEDMTCKTTCQILSFVVLLSFSLDHVSAQTASGDTLASVNGSKITASQLNELTANFVADGGVSSPELKQVILNDLIVREAINQDVKKTGLLNSPRNAFQIKVAQQNAVMEIWFSDYLKKHPLTEADLAAQYEKEIAFSKDPKNFKEYLISQIVLGSEVEANQVIDQLKGGSIFEALAKAKSIDKPSAEQGGQLGWMLPVKLKPQISDLIHTLPVGPIPQKPIKVDNAWFVIRVGDVRPFTLPSFEQAKPLIAQALVRDRRQQAIIELMKTTKIVKN